MQIPIPVPSREVLPGVCRAQNKIQLAVWYPAAKTIPIDSSLIARQLKAVQRETHAYS
jgi:hypothetical protein